MRHASAAGDRQGTGLDPKLGPLECVIRHCYHVPLAGSPLIDSGSGCPPTDQRGAPRLGACDIGAIESVPLQQKISAKLYVI